MIKNFPSIGDKFKLKEGLTYGDTGIRDEILKQLYSKDYLIVERLYQSNNDRSKEVCVVWEGWYFLLSQITMLEEDEGENKMKLRIKYFEGATKLEKIGKGNWIDVYSNKDVFVPVGERAMIPLGFALELPKGWEGHLAPRSSTFKTWGIIQTNHVGIVDDTYIGDGDMWHMPVYCLQPKNYKNLKEGDKTRGAWIRKGDKIGQFRIMEVMPELEFEEVESFGNQDRGGFGTTGSK